MMGLTPSQAKVRKVTAKPCAASNMIVGAPTAVIRLDGVRMAFRPVIEAQHFTLFTEERHDGPLHPPISPYMAGEGCGMTDIGASLRDPALLASLPEPASSLGPSGDDPWRIGEIA